MCFDAEPVILTLEVEVALELLAVSHPRTVPIATDKYSWLLQQEGGSGPQ